MRITLKELGNNPETQSGADGALNQVERIIKGVNDLFNNYWRIQGKMPPADNSNSPQQISGSPMSFNEAREKKKAELAGKAPNQAHHQPQMQSTTEFKELLAGLIKATASLEKMGFGNKLIGEVIMELPFTLNQSKDFLTKLYKSKYENK